MYIYIYIYNITIQSITPFAWKTIAIKTVLESVLGFDERTQNYNTRENNSHMLR